jgi:hypothetical protein
MPAGNKWRLSGDYFENSNCDVVCPCLFSTVAPLTARPTQGECNVLNDGGWSPTDLTTFVIGPVAKNLIKF